MEEQSFDRFQALSVVLTGEAAVAGDTARRHLATLRATLGESAVEEVLRRFAVLQAAGGDLTAAVGRELIADAAVGPTLKAMVLLWFTGQTDAGTPSTTQEDFFEALMWPAVGAHAPAFSDGYYGHWRYPPDTGG